MLSGTYNGSYELTGKHKKYILEYSDKDHWFAMIHHEIISINIDGLKMEGDMTWKYKEVDE